MLEVTLGYQVGAAAPALHCWTYIQSRTSQSGEQWLLGEDSKAGRHITACRNFGICDPRPKWLQCCAGQAVPSSWVSAYPIVHALLMPIDAYVGRHRPVIGRKTGGIILSHLKMDEVIALVQRIDEVDGARQQVHPFFAPFCLSEKQVPLV